MKQFILALTVVALAVAGASAVRTVLAVEVAAASPVPQEKVVPLDKVPGVVVKALKDQYPKAQILEIEEMTCQNTYEFVLKEGGLRVLVVMSMKGNLRYHTQEIKDADLPAAVKKAFKDRYPHAEVEKMLMVTTPPKVRYEYEIKTAKDRREVEFDAQGKLWDEVIKPAGSVKPE